MATPRLLVLAGLVAAAALARFLPYLVPDGSAVQGYLWNFTPIAAMALFGGACFANLWLALLVLLLALGLSDLGLFLVHGFAPNPVVYACFAAVVPLGVLLRQRRTLPAIAGAALASSCGFYLVTNFVVWIGSPAEQPLPDGYPRTFAGLIECYTLALPFFRNGLMGDLCYSAVLFGGLALAERRLPVLPGTAIAPVGCGRPVAIRP